MKTQTEQLQIVGRIQAGALAQLEEMMHSDMPIYHDTQFLRAEILRITEEVRANIAAAKRAA